MTLATQSASDIIGIGSGWFDSIINTCDRFVVFRQNGQESPEACANLFGTELHVTTTARSNDFDFTGEASNTADREFIVHPDTIRNLKNNYGILFDKKQNKISFFKNEFIQFVAIQQLRLRFKSWSINSTHFIWNLFQLLTKCPV